MSESCAVMVYENERLHRRLGWISHNKEPFVMKETLEPCKPLDEITVPSHEWLWSTNWKIIKMPGATDEDGWEYASKYSRFKVKNRIPKSEASWCKARRRLWTRVMRRELGVKATDITKVLPKIQAGLTSINAARKKIEEIMRHAPSAAESDEMKHLVTSVYRNIQEILSIIEQAEKQIATLPANSAVTTSSNKTAGSGQLPNPAALKKLKNEVLREQSAIERALDPSIAINSLPSTPQKITSGSGKNAPFSSSGTNGNTSMASSLMSSSLSSSYNQKNASFSSSLQRGSSFRGGNPVGMGSSNKMNGSGLPPVDDYGRMSDMRPSDLRPSDLRPSDMSVNDNDESLEMYMNAKKHTTVKSGSAGAFNPSIFASSNTKNNRNITITSRLGGDDEVEDGVFVDRSTQDLLISQKLIPIDESTVMQEIIDDRTREIEKIHTGIVELNDMFKDLSKLVKEQEEEIGTICDNIESANSQTKVAFQQIMEANRLHQNGSCMIS